MSRSVIVAGARTPIGKLSGAFASLSAMDLGGVAIRATLERAGVAPDVGVDQTHSLSEPLLQFGLHVVGRLSALAKDKDLASLGPFLLDALGNPSSSVRNVDGPDAVISEFGTGSSTGGSFDVPAGMFLG